MKRMMIATALATTLGTTAFAANQAQMEQVDTYASGVDTSTYTDRDYDIAYGFITSGMSKSEVIAKLRALSTEDNVDSGMAMISEAEMVRLQRYAPDADLTTITQDQAETALAVTYGGEPESMITERVQNILAGMEMDAETMAVVSQGQMNMLSNYISEDEIATLNEDQLELALGYAYSGMSRGDKLQQIESLLN